MFGLYKSIVSSPGYRRSLSYVVADWRSPSLLNDRFMYDNILEDAVAAAKLTNQQLSLSGTLAEVPDEKWWRKLCIAVRERPRGNYGGQLLRTKLVRALSNRIMVDSLRREFKTEIEQQKIVKPVFVVSLPRCTAQMATHVMQRTGYFAGLRCRDTLFPGVVNEYQRQQLAAKALKNFYWRNPYLQTIRTYQADGSDDDLQLHLMTPYSIAWGWWHGLDDFMYECIQEDQQGVFNTVRDTLQLFQWYQKEGHFSDFVKREVNPIDNALNITQDGTKDAVEGMTWIVHSPTALLSMPNLHMAFPDMRLIWVHRALAYCVPSQCSSLGLQHSLYTGRKPTSSKLAMIGEQVCGMWGSGSENAIDYLATFPKERMVHWSNRDVNRSCGRLVRKTMDVFGSGVDYFRRLQTINGITEFATQYRPKHDADLQYFALHEGMVNEAFAAYILQFPEYAYEKKFGITVTHYQSLSSTMQATKISSDQDFSVRETSLQHMGDPGHFLQERNK